MTTTYSMDTYRALRLDGQERPSSPLADETHPELDVVLRELESAGKVKLSEAKGKLIVGLRISR